MGDDALAPHLTERRVPASTPLSEVVSQLPLASIAGGRATWVVEVLGRAVAVRAQQWDRPELLVADRPVGELATDGVLVVHSRYLLQRDPDEVLRSLRG